VTGLVSVTVPGVNDEDDDVGVSVADDDVDDLSLVLSVS
jgi:hypothetical protein